VERKGFAVKLANGEFFCPQVYSLHFLHLAAPPSTLEG
jgi:hypothetical protein